MTELSNDSPRVAVLGLGLIGSIWARHFHAAGRLAASWNRTAKADFPAWVASPREAAERADLLVVVVSDPAAVDQVLSELRTALSSRHLIVQSSTIGPADSTRFRAAVDSTGARYLEAPFTGSKPAAEAKKTVFYLGGDADTVAAAEPVLSLISEKRLLIGSGEQACVFKLAMNLQIAALTEALCEALFISRQAGISDEVFFEGMRGNASWSGLAALKEPKLRAGDFSPQFSVKHLLKDLRLLDQAAGSLPALNMVMSRLKRASEAGEGNLDFSVIYRQMKSAAK